MSNEFLGTRTPVLRAAVIVAGIGCLLGLIHALSLGEFVTKPIENEVNDARNDFMYFGRHLAEGGLESLNPVYRQFIDGSFTLPAKLSEALIRYTGSENWPRLIIIATYGALFGLGVPVLVYTVTSNLAVSVACVFLIYFLPGIERIYGYSVGGFTTGTAGAGLFLFLLALVMAKQFVVAGLLWPLLFWLHPTIAVMWSPILIATALLSKPLQVHRIQIDPILVYALCFAAPIAMGLAVVLIEASGLMMQGVSLNEYWAIMRTVSYHSIFLGIDRYHLLVAYLSQVVALCVLGLTPGWRAILKRVNFAFAYFGLGMLVYSVILVETQQSVLAVATLPLRFATAMYGLLLVNLVYAICKGSRTDSRILAGAILASFLAHHLHPSIKGGYAPLLAIWIWPVLQWHFEKGRRMGQAVPWLAIGLSVEVALLLLLPASRDEWNPVGPMRHIEELVRALPFSGRNAVYTATALVALAAVFVAAVVARIVTTNRFLVRVSVAGLVVVTLVLSTRAISHRFPPESIAKEIVAIAKGVEEEGPTTELREWILVNVPTDASILSDPTMTLRRVLRHNVSLDVALLHSVPYIPQTAAIMARDYLRDYGIDFAEYDRKGRHVRQVELDAPRWTEARDRALAGELPYAFVVERTNRPRAYLDPIFENDGYRVYRRP